MKSAIFTMFSFGLICLAVVSGAVADEVKLGTFEVVADEDWQDPGITVESGNTYKLTASGSWTTNEKKCGWSGPDGRSGPCADLFLERYPPVVSGSYQALVGRIGEGAGFIVGAGMEFVAKSSGALRFRINDAEVALGNNDGTVNVEIIRLQ